MGLIASKSGQGPVSLYAAFEATASQFPDKVALKGGAQGLTLTYGETLDTVRRLAAGLQSPEYAGSTEIGLIGENRPEWPIAYLAVVASGKTVVPIDANLRANEIESIIRHAGLAALFASGRLEKVVASLRPDLKVFSFEADSPNHWSRLMSDPVDFTPVGSRDAAAALIYTSGTTGTPKAVVLTHGNILSNLLGIDEAIYFDEKDTQLSILPLHHTFETTAGCLTPLTHGGTIVFARSLKSKEVLDDIDNNGVTVMCGVPLLYEKMYHAIDRRLRAAPLGDRIMFKVFFGLSAVGRKFGWGWGRGLFAGLRKKAGMSRMRVLVSGAAALPPQIHRFFVLLGFDFLQGYGMTETSPVITVQRPEDIRFGSVGRPLIGVEVKIDNPDENRIGEILARGENCTLGYRNNPEQTAELWRDGWLHTGDLGKLEHGHLWITGRAKNLIVSAGGKNIYPEELEEKLWNSNYVLEVVVFGRAKQGRQGEEVRALLVPDLEQFRAEFGMDPNKPDHDKVRGVLGRVVAEVNADVADYKRITGFDIQYHELEKTSTKKVKRFIYT